ncbi:MAG: BON domain-containing protein [Desulfovibrionaceae bacterium]|nr:BON domain-containing protein [Desulfovibrionaceae bacterium]
MDKGKPTARGRVTRRARRALALALLFALCTALQGCLATSLLSFLPFLPKFTSTALSGAHFLYTYAMDGRSTRDMVADKAITVQAKAALAQGGVDDAVNVTVHCFSGHVFLVGEMDGAEDRDAAVRAVADISGVKTVTPVVRLAGQHPAGPAQCNSAQAYITAQQIYAQTMAETALDSSNLEIGQVGCDMVLLGLIDSAAEANRILATAQEIAGPARVRSYMVVTDDPALTPALAMVAPPETRPAPETLLADAGARRAAPAAATSDAPDAQPIAFSAPEPMAPAPELRYVNTAVNVRASRTSKARISARLNPGDQVGVRFLKDNWYAVYAPGALAQNEEQALGFVFAPLLLRPES